MVLSDRDIMKVMEEGELGIEPFREKSLTPNGYDLSIESVLVPGPGSKTEKGTAAIPPKSWFVVGTQERVRLGRTLAAQLWLRTTYARKGILATFGKIDAGFAGNLTVTAFNASDEAVEIPVGERFCQMVLERLDSPAEKLYAERSGRYQGQKGITLSAWEKGAPKPRERPLASMGQERSDDKQGPCRQNGCSCCCEGTEMPLTNEDVRRISALGFHSKDFVVSNDGWLQLRNTMEGNCFFLSYGLCSIYPDRPEGCRMYPIVFDLNGAEAVLDPDCQHRDGFLISAEKGRLVSHLADRLRREKRERRFRKAGQ
jgi:dCTP deaminase